MSKAYMEMETRMKLAMMVCSVAAAVTTAAEEWIFEVEADAPRVVSCKVGRDWPARMATNDVAAVGADGSTTPVQWTLDTTVDQPELVFLAAGHTHFTLLPRAGGSRSCATATPPLLSVTTTTDGESAFEFTSSFTNGECALLEFRLFKDTHWAVPE